MNKNIIIGLVGVVIIVGGILLFSDGDTPTNENNTLNDSQINTVIEKTLLIIDSVIEKNEGLKRPSTFLVKDFEESIFKLSNSDSNLEIRDLAKKIYEDYK